MTAPSAPLRDGVSPVAGKRVLLTRSADDCAASAALLAQHAAEAVTFPCIDAEPVASAGLTEALRAALVDAEWLVFTSRRGVEGFMRHADRAGSEHARIAVVGPATAEAATRLLGRVDLVGELGTGDSLADTMLRAGVIRAGTSVVLALAENAREVVERKLAAAGAACRRFNVYRTVPAPVRTPKLPLSGFEVDAVWLASPSAAEGFTNQVDIDCDVPLIAIGPSTAQALRERGLRVAAEAVAPTFAGLLEATR